MASSPYPYSLKFIFYIAVKMTLWKFNSAHVILFHEIFRRLHITQRKIVTGSFRIPQSGPPASLGSLLLHSLKNYFKYIDFLLFHISLFFPPDYSFCLRHPNKQATFFKTQIKSCLYHAFAKARIDHSSLHCMCPSEHCLYL